VTLTLFETIQRIVQEELVRVRTAELGLVQKQHPHASESDTDNYACTVQLRDSGMVLKEVPVATSRMGVASIPAVGDMVLVQFIGGDINHGVITGSVYNDEDRPPPNDDGQAILHLPLGAGDNDAVHIALTSGSKREIGIKLGSGLSISLRDDDPAVELDVDSGKATVKIDRDGAISIKSNGKITMEASDIDIHASGQLNLKGDSVVNIN